MYLFLSAMNCKRIICFTGIIWLFFSCLPAQAQKKNQRIIDSLQTLLKKAKEDTNKVKLLNALANENRSNLAEFKNYADEINTLSVKLKFRNGEVMANSAYFNYYRNLGNFDKCIEYADKNLKIAQELKDPQKEANAYNIFGIIYGSGLNRNDRAIEYFKKALNKRLSAGIKTGLETLYNNIADAYNSLNKNLDSALYYVDKAIELVEKDAIKDMAKKRSLATFYSTKGEIYSTLKEWAKSVHFLNLALSLHEQTNDFSTHSYIYNYLGGIYEAKNKPDSAMQMYQESLAMFEKTKIKRDILKTYEGLARVLEKKNQPAEALKYYRLMIEGQNANIQETNEKMRVLENEHDRIEREREKKIAAEWNAIYRWGSVVAVVVILVMSFFLVQIFRSNQTQKRISRELTKTNQEVQEKSQELLAMNEELNSTVEELNITIETVDQQKQLIELANQRMHDSIKYGKKIQEAILPTEQEMQNGFDDYFAIYLPRDVVSGDFYWYFKLDDKTQYLAVVDCTGHGVPGAFMAMIGYSLLNQILSETKITEPAEILHYLDLGVVQGLRQTNAQNVDGMDVCLCKVVTLPNNQYLVDYAGAKRPLFYSDMQVIQLIRPTRESIGGFNMNAEDRAFQSQQITLNKGEVLYLTTDGFTDNPNKNRKRFGEERFAKLLQAVVSNDMKDQQELLMSAYHAHQEGASQRDDITIVGVRL
jgi:serine phosphatase RsbU (regulator of sigma subunit)